jgi:hypothetical protein
VDVTREQAVEILRDAHGRVTALVARIGEDDLGRRGTIGGGEWSAKDLVAHLSSWEEIALRSLEDWRRGVRPWIESVYEDDGAVDRLNAENVLAWLAAPATVVLERFERSHLEITEAIAGTSDGEWTTAASHPTEDETRTLGRLLGGVLGAPDRPFGHAYAHLKDLETYVESPT